MKRDEGEPLRGPKRIRETAPAYGNAPPTAPEPAACAVTMADRGRLVLPAAVRERLKIKAGDRLTLVLETDGSLRVLTSTAYIRRVRGAFKHLAPGRILSDELIAERRLEAAKDDQKDRAFMARHRPKKER